MRSITVGAASLLALFASIGESAAGTFPVQGTERFETGLQRLAAIDIFIGSEVVVDWGDGTDPQPGLLDCLVGVCDVYGTHRYTSAGTFTITVQYTTPVVHQPATVTTTATISPVGDFVILSIGDSVASGEGNPVVPIRGFWDDPGSNYDYPAGAFDAPACHRSSGAGPALVASTVGLTNPVTFIHAACSGNDVDQTINGLRNARGRLPRIDVLLISAGANEVSGGFGKLLERCIVEVTNQCSEDATFRNQVAADVASLDGKYEKLAASVACLKSGPDGAPVFDEANCGHMVEPVPPLVLITDYFDPTHNGEGKFPSQAESVTCGLGVVSPSEWGFLYSGVVVPLNRRVNDSTPKSPAFPRYTRWEPITGIQEDFLTHGYCANPGPAGLFGDPWVVKLPDSLVLQGDAQGTGHPNTDGQADYRRRTYARLRALNPPRTTADALVEGRAYAFGTWTGKDVVVEFAATNPIRESGVGPTYYAIDNPDCVPDGALDANCSVYTGPFTIDTSGRHTVTYFSFNAFEGREPPKSVQVWIDKDPPKMTCSADPSVLWPPNGKLVDVETSVEAVDAVFGPAPFSLVAATTSQGNPQADIKGFAIGQPDTQGSLRARREGNIRQGRIYLLSYESADPLGNVGRCPARVVVPHDQRAKVPPAHKPARP